VTLVVLARGSCQPAGPRVVEAVAARVRLRLPGVLVRTAYAEITRPSLPEVLSEVAEDAVVVPLPGAQDTVPTYLTRAPGEVRLAEPLGPDRLLAGVMLQRLLAAGARPGQPVVLVAAGSHLARAQGNSLRAAQLLEEVWRGPVRAAHLTGRGLRMSEVVSDFRAMGLAAPAVAPYLVAPGPSLTRARADARTLGLDLVADVLGDHPQVAEALARRYRATLAHRFAVSLA
jgi:sirohydrochlorin ferrochelatase